MPLIKLNATLGLTGSLPAVSGANLTGISAGKVLQVVSANDNTSRSTTSNSFVTGSNTLSVNITPSSSSNKVYVIVSVNVHGSTTTANAISTIYRDSTNLGNGTSGFATCYSEGGADIAISQPMSILDSPNTTSQVTYQVYFRAGSSANAFLNAFNEKGTITAFEIEG
jgi:hypothetical protein